MDYHVSRQAHNHNAAKKAKVSELQRQYLDLDSRLQDFFASREGFDGEVEIREGHPTTRQYRAKLAALKGQILAIGGEVPQTAQERWMAAVQAAVTKQRGNRS